MNFFGGEKDKYRKILNEKIEKFKEDPSTESLVALVEEVREFPSEYTPVNVPWKMFEAVVVEMAELKKDLKKITG